MHRADRIRNVALVGHRGSGKTSLQRGAAATRPARSTGWASVIDGTTASDSDPDEQARQMSISASLSSFEWDDRKINLLDTPGEPSFVADALGALRVCESAVFVVNARHGRRGRRRMRLWQRAEELDLARMVFVNMLDRERADFFRTLESLKAAFGPHVVATEIPIGSEHEVRGVIDLVDMKAYEYDGDGRDNCARDPDPRRAPGAGRGVPREADGRGRRGLRRAHGALPRGRGDLPRGDRHRARRTAPTTAASSRSSAASRRATSAPTGCSTRSSRTCRRPVKHGGARAARGHARARRGRASCSPTSSRRRPTRSPGASTSSASTRAS